MELTAKERAQVKKVSRELLQTLKAEKLALDRRKRQQVRVAIETLLADPQAGAQRASWAVSLVACVRPLARDQDLAATPPP